ncbi:hypothetical protein IW146_009366 [Coemansia sp. RSA 922]|nr:hypothetical protein H4S03_007264 [Coemansia sp. S3946]KAJ2042382.1 hypothetical protein H4S04_007327 [Coemansia sp. S16]KAJ2058380.1 hypothetical protein GGI08_003442 [Coemansia sp. S2]KAJ2101275.1 hypothetical protein IW146_009366 [Coemansia sp. RSA 922]
MAIYELLYTNLGRAAEYLWQLDLIPSARLAVVAAGTLSFSYVFYSLYLSPYCRIPGRLLYRLSSLPSRLVMVLGRLSEVAEADYYIFGDIFMMRPNVVILSNPADCRTVLSTHRFVKSDMYKAFALVDETMFTTHSAELTNMRRRQVGPAFTHGYLNEMEPIILECGIRAIRAKWDKEIAQSTTAGSAIVNYGLHFSMVTFDVLGALGYGQRFNALRDNTAKLADWVNDYNKLAIVKMVYDSVLSFPANLLVRRLIQSRDKFVAFGNAAAEHRREQLRRGEIEKPKDLLQILIDCQDPESKVKMNATQVTAENISFLVGGTDTTALTMSWTLHYLMLYPDVYRRATEEVRAAFPRHYTITYAEGKARLPYIDACISESLRIRGASGVPLPRVVPEGGATFQGHFLPAGTLIGVNVAGANHHQGTWKNPRRFMPERFLDDEKARHNILTFSSGVRICPGRNLAQYEMMTMIANLLKDYDFAVPSDSLFTPERLDEHGNPIAMPRTHSLSVGPRFPERDCRIVISLAPEY